MGSSYADPAAVRLAAPKHDAVFSRPSNRRSTIRERLDPVPFGSPPKPKCVDVLTDASSLLEAELDRRTEVDPPVQS
jgi:hypothetical protein